MCAHEMDVPGSLQRRRARPAPHQHHHAPRPRFGTSISRGARQLRPEWAYDDAQLIADSRPCDRGARTRRHRPARPVAPHGRSGGDAMIVVMETSATSEQVNGIVARVKELGLGAHLSEGEERTIIGVVGTPLPPTLDESSRSTPASSGSCASPRSTSSPVGISIPQKTTIKVRDVEIGGDEVTSSPDRARSRAKSRRSRRRARSRPPAPRSCAAAPTSRAPRRTSSADWDDEGWRFWPRRARRPGMPIITEVMTPATSTRSTSTPTSSRSARATARTTSCWRRSARPASRSCSSAACRC